MIISVTERGSFKRCRRQWWIGSFNGLAKTPLFSKPALNLGSCWHKACELWLEGQPAPCGRSDEHEHHGWTVTNVTDPATPPVTTLCSGQLPGFHTIMDRVVQENQAAVEEAVHKAGQHIPPIEQASLNIQHELLTAMAMNYEAKWGSPLPEGFSNVKAEQTIVVPIPGTDHKLEATLDGLIRQDSTGDAYVLERKTYGRRPDEHSLMFNDQFIAYMWILRQLNIPTMGVAYDGVWKRPAPPKGRVFDDLFIRFTLTHTNAELDEFERFLAEEANDMADARYNEARRYTNKRWEGCWDCPAAGKDDRLGLCDLMTLGHDIAPMLTDSWMDRPIGERALVWPSMAED